MRRNKLNMVVVFAFGLVLLLGLSRGMAVAQSVTWPAITSAIPQDPDIEAAVADLVANMSVDEKIGQMTQVEIQHVTPGEIRQYHIGSVLNGGGSWPGNNKSAAVADWVALADSYWQAAMDTSDGNAAIPIIWGVDAVHGHNNVLGATVFPHNIGLGAAHDPDLIEQIGQITAREVAVTGLDWVFAPCLAVARDDRWGRTYEGYAEDPEIVGRYAGRMIEGLQGALTDTNVVATAKHYLGDGGTDQGKDQGDTLVSEEVLRDLHGAGYFTALAAGAQTVMASFSSWNGAKMHGNAHLLTDVLKGQMGFDGFVVSDWNGIGQVPGCTNSSCAQAINAGIDMVMVPYRADWTAFIANTRQQVLNGEIPMSRIDDAVTRILRVKMRAGLFTTSPASRSLANHTAELGSAANRAVARQAVRESLVLLKNTNHILPLSKQARVLVAGKSADSIMNQTGGWTLTWQGTGNTNADFPGATSIWQGIQAVAPNATLSPDGTAAGAYDVAIAVIGETPYAEGVGDIGKSQTLEHAKRNPEDLAVLQTLVNRGIPVVTVFVTGRPLYVNKEVNRSAAFVAAWLPGSEGQGIADVLFGDYGFTGQLSFSWPGSPCQTPLNHGDAGALFPYGYGLVYGSTDTLGTLPEEERNYGCGQTDPGNAGTTDTILDIFKNGANVNNGDLLGNYVLRIGGPSNWGGVDVATDPSQTTTLPGNEMAVTTVDGLLQNSAKHVVWNGQGQVYAQVAAAQPGVDLAPYANSETSLKFRVRVNAPPAGNVTLSAHCVYPCLGELPFGETLRALPVGQWQEISAPLQCLINDGLDVSNVNTPFLIWSEGALDLSLEEIRWEPWTAGPNPDCSAFGGQVDVITDDVYTIFNNSLAAGYEFRNWQNPSSVIVPDPEGSGQVWSATLQPGTNVELYKTGKSADMSAYNTATGRLAFDIRFAGVDAATTDVLVKVGPWPALSDMHLFSEVLGGQPQLNTWIPVSITVPDLAAHQNSLSPTDGPVNLSSVNDLFILESLGGSAAIYVRNVRWIRQEIVETCTEKIVNGTFDNTLAPWGHWEGDGGAAAVAVENGELKIDVANAGAFPWSVQIYQEGLTFVTGQTYTVNFDARAAVPRQLNLAIGKALSADPWFIEYVGKQTYDLGTQTQHYSVTFTMNEPSYGNGKLVFEAGNIAGGNALTTVWIDNVSVQAEGCPQPPETLSYDGYRLWWADEFDGSALNPVDWSYDIGYGPNPYARGWGNSELQWYTDAPDNLAVQDGKLMITLRKLADGIPTSVNYPAPGIVDPNPSYTSARIHTQKKVAFKYGIVTARMKLPQGNGVWPAFWMMGDQFKGYYEQRPAGAEPWPVCGEIDIMELAGRIPNLVSGALHFGGQWPDNHYLGGSDASNLGTPYTLPDGTFNDGFHTFTVKWEEGVVRWYVDDQLFQVIHAENDVLDWYSQDMDTGDRLPAPAPFNKEFFILLNLALAGEGTAFPAGVPDATTVFPQTLEVDYVRVYTATEPPPVPTSTPGPGSVIPEPGTFGLFGIGLLGLLMGVRGLNRRRSC